MSGLSAITQRSLLYVKIKKKRKKEKQRKRERMAVSLGGKKAHTLDTHVAIYYECMLVTRYSEIGAIVRVS